MNLLNIKQHHARALFIFHQWKIDRIYDCFDRKGRDRMLREADIVLQEKSNTTPSSSSKCNVCFDDDLSLTDVSTMDCGHCFCNNCEFATVPQHLSSDCTIISSLCSYSDMYNDLFSIAPLAATLSWSLPLLSFCMLVFAVITPECFLFPPFWLVTVWSLRFDQINHVSFFQNMAMLPCLPPLERLCILALAMAEKKGVEIEVTCHVGILVFLNHIILENQHGGKSIIYEK
jgi:hypothetical protein